MIDYHVHTALCHHARGSMEGCVVKAVSLGLSEICFLDHLTVRPGKKPNSMTPEEVPLYFGAVKALKDAYAENLEVKVGIEADFNPLSLAMVERIVDTFDFDVVAFSVHFLNDLDIVSHGAAKDHDHLDPDDLYARYLDTLDHLCRTVSFDLICHLDLIKKFGKRSSGDFTAAMDPLLALVREKGLVVEVNTSGLDHPIAEIYPSQSLLKACRAKGIPVTLGSDAHAPEAVGGHLAEGFSAVVAAGYESLTGFTRRTAYPIPINKQPDKDDRHA